MVLAVLVGLICAPGGYAETISWTVSGGGVTGSGTITDTGLGGGLYQVTSMTGNLTVFDTVSDQAVGGTITGLVPYTGTPSPGNYETGIYEYNNLLYSSGTPEFDMYGLAFNVSGFSAPLELCSDPKCNLASGTQTWLWDLEQVTSPSPYAGLYGTYYAFPVTFATPEPSVLSLLTLGLVG